MRVYYDNDADLARLLDKKIAIVGAAVAAVAVVGVVAVKYFTSSDETSSDDTVAA